MKTLILQNDDRTARLLETVVAGLSSGISCVLVETLTEAFILARDEEFHLFIVDRTLPDGSGLELVRHIRERDKNVPVVMVCDRADRNSVLQAARCGISSYFARPLDVTNLHNRLGKLLKVDQINQFPSIEALLRDSLTEVIQLPSDVDPADVIELIARQNELSAAQLAQHWRTEASLTARLLDVANSSSLRRSGKPLDTLKDAIGLLGVPLALNQALALSLDVSTKLQQAPLQELARAYREEARQLAVQAQRLAITLKKPPLPLEQAALLSRLGELAVIKVLNQHIQGGGEISTEDAKELLNIWSEAYRNRLKVQWKLPIGARELIGAVHALPSNCIREDQLIIRAAYLLTSGQQRSEECIRLLRRIGIEPTNDSGEEDRGD